MKLEVGVVVMDRFRLVQPLGQGGFASVWLAADLQAPKSGPVALKVLRPEQRKNLKILERFLLEGRLLVGLDHPAISRAFEVYDRPHLAFYTMEYIGGRTLKNDIERRVRRAKPYESDELIAIIESLGRALDFAHARDIAHRDLKPANVMLVLADKNDGERIKLVDFGIAKDLAAEPPDETTAGHLLGSTAYMSPEQTRCQHVTARTDVWAMATIVFELVTLRRAWLLDQDGAPLRFGKPVVFNGANTASAVFDRINRGPRPRSSPLTEGRYGTSLDDVLARGMAVSPDDRPSSAGELAAALAAALSSQRSRTRALPRPEAPPGAMAPSAQPIDPAARTLRDTSLDVLFASASNARGAQIVGPTDLAKTDEHDTTPDDGEGGWPSGPAPIPPPRPALAQPELLPPELMSPVVPQPFSRSDIASTGYVVPEPSVEPVAQQPATPPAAEGPSLGGGFAIVARTSTKLRAIDDWDRYLRFMRIRRAVLALLLVSAAYGLGYLLQAGAGIGVMGPLAALVLSLALIVGALGAIGNRRTMKVLLALQKISATTQLRFEIDGEDGRLGFVLLPDAMGATEGVLADMRRVHVRLRTRPAWRHAWGSLSARVVVNLPQQAALVLGHPGEWRGFPIHVVVAEMLKQNAIGGAERRAAADAELLLRRIGGGTLETNGHELAANVRLEHDEAGLMADQLGAAVRALLVTVRLLWTGKPPIE